MDRQEFMTILREESVEATSALQSRAGSDAQWWEYVNFGSLRSGCDQCPLTFVANCFEDRYDPSEWEAAAKELEMDKGLARQIVLAADARMLEDGYDQELRDELIDACNATLKVTRTHASFRKIPSTS